MLGGMLQLPKEPRWAIFGVMCREALREAISHICQDFPRFKQRPLKNKNKLSLFEGVCYSFYVSCLAIAANHATNIFQFCLWNLAVKPEGSLGGHTKWQVQVLRVQAAPPPPYLKS